MRCDRGSATAEFAIVLPVVLLMLGVCLSAIGVAASAIRLQDATADAARIVARGEGEGSAASRVTSEVAGARLGVTRSGDYVCVTTSATAKLGPLWFASVPIEARSCALDGGR